MWENGSGFRFILNLKKKEARGERAPSRAGLLGCDLGGHFAFATGSAEGDQPSDDTKTRVGVPIKRRGQNGHRQMGGENEAQATPTDRTN